MGSGKAVSREAGTLMRKDEGIPGLRVWGGCQILTNRPFLDECATI
jgi:hypothetical protein